MESGLGSRAARRSLLVLWTVGVVLVAVEAVGWLGLWVVDREPASHASLERQRAARASGALGGTGLEEVRQRADLYVARALHPYLGWVKDADASPDGLGPTDPEAREFGFPDNPAPLFQPADPRRLVVVVLGGSFAAALVRDAGDALATGLGSLPRFEGREPLVLTLALPGFKQPQQLMALSWFLALGAHFDLVINLDGYNELIASATNVEMRGVFPAYPKRWFERVADLEGGLRLALGEAAYIQELRAEQARRFSRAPWRFSMLAGLVWRLQDRDLEGRLAGAQARMAGGGAATAYHSRGPRQSFGSTVDLLEEVAALWARSSQQMDALARNAGAEYHHFLQPNQYVEGSKPWTDAEQRKARETGSRRAELVVLGYPLLQREGTGLGADGVRFHDLTGVFAETGETVYIDSCCHVNRFGSRRVAQEIARSVGRARPLD